MQIWQVEKELAARLAHVDSPRLCAGMLLRHVLGLDEIGYLLAMRQELPAQARASLETLVERRAAGEPMAYILGHREFHGRGFLVSPAVLVPRPDTETLVDLALGKIADSNALFVDAGCGSGCIGISLMLERPEWRGILLDNDIAALEIASLNSKRLNVQAKLALADMAKMPFADSALDFIVSNPPYIDAERPDEAMPEVLAYEPHSALFSGQGGFAHIQALAAEARRVLRKGGLLLMEHGFAQAEGCQAIFHACGFSEISTVADLAGLPRCTCARN